MNNVTVKIGNIFASNAQTLVNTVNTVGVMGKGIALEFKERFPDMYKDYLKRCEKGEVRLGEPYIYKQLFGPSIINFPTKEHWRSVSKLSDIISGLEYLQAHYREWGVESIAVPPLGCGNGQLDWSMVGPTLYRHLRNLDIRVELYAPFDTPIEQLKIDFLARRYAAPNRIQPAAIAIIAVLSRVTREPYHWPIGRTTFQKIAYFSTKVGVPTRLTFIKGSYGPFSESLKPLMGQLVNNDLVTETRMGQMFLILPGPTYKDARNFFKEQLREWAPKIEKVADLCLRLPRSRDAEIAASVHFIAEELIHKNGAADRPTELQVLNAVKEWKQNRKPGISEQEFARMIRNLNVLGWIDVKGSRALIKSDREVELA